MTINNEKPWQINKGPKTIEDTILARGFIRDIGGTGKVTAIIGFACHTLNQLFPHHGEPRKQWTERRLWAWWNDQSDVVRHWQMRELYMAASKAKNERELLEAARREHNAFIAKTARLATLLQHQDEAFHSAQVAALRGCLGNVDLSRDGGE